MPRFAFVLVLFAAWIAHGLPARADTVTRTSVVPSAGTAVGLGRQVVLGARVEGRQVFGPTSVDQGELGFGAATGVHVGLTPIFGLSVGYAYSHGVFPTEGPATREHDIPLGLSIGRDASDSHRFGIFSRTKAELRIMDLPTRGWHTEVRPREELTVTLRMRQWMQASLVSEALFQPSHPPAELLQVRVGPALHGAITLQPAKQQHSPRLLWFAGAQASLWPIALGQARAREIVDPDVETPEPQVIDVLVRFGLSAVF